MSIISVLRIIYPSLVKKLKLPKKDGNILKPIAINIQTKQRFKRFGVFVISIILGIYVPYFVQVTLNGNQYNSFSTTWLMGFLITIFLSSIGIILIFLFGRIFEWIWHGR